MLWKMAFRNIFRQKRRSLFTVLSMVIGFLMLSLTMALTEGGFENIIKMFTKNHTGHVQIHHKEYLERPGLYRLLDACCGDNLNGYNCESSSGVQSGTHRPC